MKIKWYTKTGQRAREEQVESDRKKCIKVLLGEIQPGYVKQKPDWDEAVAVEKMTLKEYAVYSERWQCRITK